ncbi:Rieske (2Fe-2S) protein [Nocardioides sp. BGMRC 2183]|nr:Rieske (2Fe-2S) protein [Nocardioides sp. BGMRC 2183]
MATLDRRHTLGGAAAAGLGAPLLAACGEDSADPDGTQTVSASPDGGNTPAESGPAETDDAPQGGGGLVAAADVPVGGGMVLADEELVITQPSDGEFRGFTAICTHRQCLVTSVTDGEIVCPCHGSHFAVADGAVVAGPAPTPLPAVEVEVVDGQVVRA